MKAKIIEFKPPQNNEFGNGYLDVLYKQWLLKKEVLQADVEARRSYYQWNSRDWKRELTAYLRMELNRFFHLNGFGAKTDTNVSMGHILWELKERCGYTLADAQKAFLDIENAGTFARQPEIYAVAYHDEVTESVAKRIARGILVEDVGIVNIKRYR